MQGLLIILFLFVIVILSIFLYFQNKGKTLEKLRKGECPQCGQTSVTFKNEDTGEEITSSAISTSVIKTNGWAGTKDIRYRCKHCRYTTIVSE